MGQHLIGQHDQRVAGQQSQRLAKGFVHGGLAAAGIGVVKGRHVVVNQGGAMHQLDGAAHGVTQAGRVVATGQRHGGTQLRPHPRAAGKHGMPHGGNQTRGRLRRDQDVEVVSEGLLGAL